MRPLITDHRETCRYAVVAGHRSIAGFDSVEILVVDHGSQDRTAEVAQESGVDIMMQHRRNRGLTLALRNLRHVRSLPHEQVEPVGHMGRPCQAL